MVYAAIAHPPVLGGKVTSVDDKAALQVMGVGVNGRVARFLRVPE
jgi:hypothetical protein